MTDAMPSPGHDDTDYAHDHPEWDDREWDSAHCCSCCCDCCACHKISHAFWWVLFFTIACLGAGAALFIDGIVKQQNCSQQLDQNSPESLNAYDSCRQAAYIQILASIAIGGLFLVMVFVSCCAFMDILCFRRWRSRPHLGRGQPLTPKTPRAARHGLTPRGTHVAYDNIQMAPPPQQQHLPDDRVPQMVLLVNGNGNMTSNGNGYSQRPPAPHHIHTGSHGDMQVYNPYSHRSARTPNMYLANDQMRRQHQYPQQLTPQPHQQPRSHVTPPSAYHHALSPPMPLSARSAPAPILLAAPHGSSSSPMPTLGEQMRLASASAALHPNQRVASSSASPAAGSGDTGTPMVLSALPIIPPRPAAVVIVHAPPPPPSAPAQEHDAGIAPPS